MLTSALSKDRVVRALRYIPTKRRDTQDQRSCVATTPPLPSFRQTVIPAKAGIHGRGSLRHIDPARSPRRYLDGPLSGIGRMCYSASMTSARRMEDSLAQGTRTAYAARHPWPVFSGSVSLQIGRMRHRVSHFPARCPAAQIGMEQNGAELGRFFGTAVATLGERPGTMVDPHHSARAAGPMPSVSGRTFQTLASWQLTGTRTHRSQHRVSCIGDSRVAHQE